MANIFITGAFGFLGSCLAEKLCAKHKVILLLRDQDPDSFITKKEIAKNCIIVKGSLENFQLMLRILNEYEIDQVYHLGAQAIVGHANRSPLSTFESNIRGSYCLLEAIRLSPWVKTTIIASTDKAYGTQEKLPYTESAPLLASHPYDVSKACADMIAQAYAKTYNLNICITRCGNIYGPGDLNLNRLIPGVITACITKKNFEIRSDGTFIRDYIYVEDVADAYINLAGSMSQKNLKGEAFNFSTMNKLSVLEVTEKIIAIMDSSIKPVVLNQAKGEIKNQYLSSEKAKTILNWEPANSFEEGIKKTIPYYQDLLKN